MSYSLLGIFGVSISVVYGEDGKKARKRLLATIREETEDVKPQPIPTQPSGGTLSKPSSNVLFRRDLDFVDRDALMDRMRERLSIPAGRMALVRLGGAGWIIIRAIKEVEVKLIRRQKVTTSNRVRISSPSLII